MTGQIRALPPSIYDVSCPFCDVPASGKCVTASGKLRDQPHDARWTALFASTRCACGCSEFRDHMLVAGEYAKPLPVPSIGSAR